MLPAIAWFRKESATFEDQFVKKLEDLGWKPVNTSTWEFKTHQSKWVVTLFLRIGPAPSWFRVPKSKCLHFQLPWHDTATCSSNSSSTVFYAVLLFCWIWRCLSRLSRCHWMSSYVFVCCMYWYCRFEWHSRSSWCSSFSISHIIYELHWVHVNELGQKPWVMACTGATIQSP